MKGIVVSTWILGAVLSFPAAGHADHCRALTQDQAEKASELLKKGARFVEYCESCDDNTIGQPEVVSDVAIAPVEGVLEARLNGRIVDLSSIYVDTTDGVAKNVAVAIGCSSNDIPATVQTLRTPENELLGRWQGQGKNRLVIRFAAKGTLRVSAPGTKYSVDGTYSWHDGKLQIAVSAGGKTATDTLSVEISDDVMKTTDSKGSVDEFRRIRGAPMQNDGRMDAVIQRMGVFRDQMCACTTTACAQDVSKQMTAWSQELSKDRDPQTSPPSEADAKQVTQITRQLTDCMTKAMATRKLYQVSIEEIVIGVKANGKKWDGPGAISSQDLQRFRDAAIKFSAADAADPVALGAGVVTVLGSMALGATDPPDPYGSATLILNGKTMPAFKLPKIQDSYTPHWSIQWASVPLDQDVRIRLELWDKDLVHDDFIGTVIVTNADLQRALADGHVFPIAVGAQCDNQIVSVNLSVIPR